MLKPIRRHIGGGLTDPHKAYEYGYRYAIVAPKGHVVSYHSTEKAVKFGMYVLRKTDCKPVELVTLL